MALTNSQGNYLKIDSYDLRNNSVNVLIYETKEHRDSGDTEFLKANIETYSLWNLKTIVDTLIPSELETIDKQIITICYAELIKVNGFSEWQSNISTEQKPIIEDIQTKIDEILPKVEETLVNNEEPLEKPIEEIIK